MNSLKILVLGVIAVASVATASDNYWTGTHAEPTWDTGSNWGSSIESGNSYETVSGDSSVVLTAKLKIGYVPRLGSPQVAEGRLIAGFANHGLAKFSGRRSSSNGAAGAIQYPGGSIETTTPSVGTVWDGPYTAKFNVGSSQSRGGQYASGQFELGTPSIESSGYGIGEIAMLDLREVLPRGTSLSSVAFASNSASRMMAESNSARRSAAFVSYGSLGGGFSSELFEISSTNLGNLPGGEGPWSVGLLTGNNGPGGVFPPLQAPPAVPEPGTLVLLAILALGALAYRQRKA